MTPAHGGEQKKKISSFEVLKNAIWENVTLEIIYQRADGQTNRYIVQPLGLVAKGSIWYFIAAKENGDIRNYRASRIQSAVPGVNTFERPDDFDIAAYWKSSNKLLSKRYQLMKCGLRFLRKFCQDSPFQIILYG